MKYLSVVALLYAVQGQPSLAQEWLSAGEKGFLPGKVDGLEITNDGILRLSSFEEVNFALGIDAYSDGTALGSKVTDGNQATGWDFDEDPKVVGKTIGIDLGGNRLVNRVRILPGSSVGAENPEFFVKGYRVEVAPEEAPDGYVAVAENLLNRSPLIDTTADGTWLRYADGAPVATLGRYVRVTITRQDLPNWVIIGEVEVFGTGFHARGEFLSPVHDFGDRVNVGAGFFQAETPRGTRVHLQFRAGVREDEYELPAWDDLPMYGVADGARGVFFPLLDPARFIQYRALLETEDPFVTPELSQVRVRFDPRLVALSANGRIEPREAPVGEPVSLTYTAEVFWNSENYPLDLLILDRPGRLEELSMRLAVVSPEKYRMLTPQGSLQEGNLIIQLDPDLIRSSVRELEIVFTTVFFKGSEEVNLFLGSSQDGSDPENLQWVAPRGRTVVTVLGTVDELVPVASVALRPRVFKPDRGGATRIEFDLTKVLVPVPVTVTIHELSGHRVCTVVDEKMLGAGEISIPWDGFDDHGGVLAPGIYFCRIRVHAQESVTLTRFLGIAY